MKLSPELERKCLAMATPKAPRDTPKKCGHPGRRPSGGESRRRQEGNPAFDEFCKAHGLPPAAPEYRFHPKQRWRLDFVFEGWLAVEVQGGLLTGCRHVRGAALLREYENINAATLAGFGVLFFTPDQVYQTGEALAVIKAALGLAGGKRA
jgi:hypothetical protein